MAEKAEEIAKKMREVSVAEFFEKNRHLLGFDNPAKALLTVIKEGVDNSLDACEEARILPEVVVDIREPREIFRIFNAENVEIGRVTINGEKVELKIEEEIIKLTERKEPSKTETVYLFEGKDATYKLRVYSKENRETYEFVRGRTELKVLRLPSDRFLIRIEDNGPGITREHIPKVFGKLLYGSKFGAQVQGRGQQGIGICMTPDTLVSLSDGSVRTIEWLVANKPDAEAFVLSPELKLVPIRIKNFWKITSPKSLIRLRTIGGTEIKLTPENPVMVRREGGMQWVHASDMAVGDYVAGARRLKTNASNRLYALDLLNQANLHADCIEFTNTVIELLRRKHGSYGRLAKHYNLTKDVVRGWTRKDVIRRPTVTALKRMASDAGFSNETIMQEIRRVGRMHHYTQIPLYVDRDFLYIAGLIAGDGNVQKKRNNRWGQNISFWNNDKKLLEEFRDISFKLFGVNGRFIVHSKGRGFCIQYSSSVVAELLESIGVHSGNKHATFTINEGLQSMPNEILVGFIQGLF